MELKLYQELTSIYQSLREYVTSIQANDDSYFFLMVIFMPFSLFLFYIKKLINYLFIIYIVL